MRLLVVMSVYNEEALVGRAIRSLAPLAPDELHVFDGAWRGGRNGSHVFGGSETGASDDETFAAVVDAACETLDDTSFHRCRFGPWASQEAKRTALFQDVGAEHGDYLLVMDADETICDAPHPPEQLRDWLEAVRPPSAAHAYMKCVGPNDLPGIRGEWPHGDYAPFFKPELRIFAYHPALVCDYPGAYSRDGVRIEAYSRDPTKQGEPALPVAPLWMLHHGNDRTPERKAAKIRYYEAEHPERERLQDALG